MSQTEKPATPKLQRINGRLHFIHHVLDDDGNVVSTITGPLKVEFHVQDLLQLVAGAAVMALPVSLTEEVWNLAADFSPLRALAIFAVSLIILAGFIWSLFYGQRIREFPSHFFKRCLSTYLVTFLVALSLLFLWDKAPLDDLGLTPTRTIIVAFPASFAATAVDFMN